jgi:hypothetical protein
MLLAYVLNRIGSQSCRAKATSPPRLRQGDVVRSQCHFFRRFEKPRCSSFIRVCFLSMILLTSAFIPLSLTRFGPEMTCARAAERDTRYISVLKFSAGIITAFAIHEGAHELVGELTHSDLHWELGNYNQPMAFTEHADSDAKAVAINSAGLLSQTVGAEVILRVDKIDKNDDFVRGMMTWNVVNPISYALDYWFFHRSNRQNGSMYQGDIQGIEHYTNEPTANAFALSVAAIAVLQGYRFLKTQSWAPDWLQGKSHSVNLAPLASGGLVLAYRFAF